MCASKEPQSGDTPEQSTSDPELNQEWEARRARFHNVGYKEGLEEGKARTLQQGFDEGFRIGAEDGFREGISRGRKATKEALRKLPARAAGNEKH